MIFSILVIVLVFAIAYFHYTQGLFSATLSAICATLAAVLAFSYHETVVYSLLGGRMANYAHAIALVALFASIYLVLRVIFDSMIPGNVSLPLYVDRVGAAVMGLIVGIFATGILTIAAASLPFGPTTPYARFEVEDIDSVTVPTGGRDIDAPIHSRLVEVAPGQFNPERRTGMILPVDQIVVNMVDRLSTGAMAGDRPLNEVHPSYLDELFGQRLGIQSGANRVAVNAGNQQQVSLQGVYTVESIPQAEGEVPHFRDKPLTLPAARQAPPNEILLITRLNFVRGSYDKDNNLRFSPASIRLVGGEQNYYPIGTIDDAGVLRINMPDDYLILPGDQSVDVVFQVPREALGLPPAARRDAAEETALSIGSGPFLEVKRMAPFDLGGKAIEEYPGPLETTVYRKHGIPEAKAAPARPGAGAAQAATDAPFTFQRADVSAELFTAINVGAAGDGEATFGSGSATVKDGKFAKLEVNTTETVQRLRMGESTIDQFFVNPGVKMVQLIGRPTEGADAWAWAGQVGQFELTDASGNKYKPHGAWAKVKGAQGTDRLAARYDVDTAISDLPAEEGVPTEVTLAFLVPEGTQLAFLSYQGKPIAEVQQQVQ